MELWLNIFSIALICVIVIDVLQFFDSIEPLLSKILGFKVRLPEKPFKCSTCSTFWLGFIWLCIAGAVTLPNVALLLCLAASTPQIENLWWNIQGIIGLLVNLLRIKV